MEHAWGAAEAARSLQVPAASDDKFSRGVVGLRTGSDEFPGAAVLGTEGAWRTGAGMVRWIGPEAVGRLVLQRRPETVLRDGRADAWVIGSGTDPALRTDAEAAALRALLAGDVPVVVDAGALELVAGHKAPVVMTPHQREFERLAAANGVELRSDRAADAVAVAAALDAVVLLKGAETIVAGPDGRVMRVTEGTPWLATAGTGDVLAGVVGALVAANGPAALAEAAASAAFLHGRAGRLAAGVGADSGPRTIVAADVAEALPDAFATVRAEAAAVSDGGKR